MMRTARRLAALPALFGLCVGALAAPPPAVRNAGFEEAGADGWAPGWIRGIGGGAKATIEVDASVARSGSRSLRITDATPTEAYKYALANTDWLAAEPQTTYTVRFWARGRNVGKCFVGATFEKAGEQRQPLPVGDYEWRPLTFRFTTPETNQRWSLRFIADGVSDGVWVDDISVERSAVQLADIPEVREPRPYADWFPRTPGPMPKQLIVADISKETTDVQAALVSLQGLVNRKGPRLYLINQTNPQRYDDLWLTYMKEKGYTGAERRLKQPLEALALFRKSVRGVVVWDPEMPGTINVAWMLAGLLDALPASPDSAKRLGLPVVEDLRGRWKRNVDAYRWVYERYWGRMSHHLLAWEYPLTNALSSRDAMVQHRVFLFWVSAHTDREKGADPQAEMEFVEEMLARTPGNVPVMGWPMFNDKGVEEYSAVRLLSEYGKWVPGTGYNSNVSVHSAIRPNPALFTRKAPEPPAPPLRADRVYVTTNIMDSGDAHWYWQFHQRRIWADPARGSVPIGYAMNMTTVDTLPLVLQWYFEKRTPNDSFFGLLYMNAPIYASRFRADDRERIWSQYVALSDRYRRMLGMDGIELYNGGSSGPTAPTAMLRRFTKGMPGLRYILADLGRHTDVNAANADATLDGVSIFHTLTNFRVWTTSEEVANKKMESENPWLAGEIAANAPKDRPGFMSTLAISWCYFPAWLVDLNRRLPADFVSVSPGNLDRLYRLHTAGAAPGRDRP